MRIINRFKELSKYEKLSYIGVFLFVAGNLFWRANIPVVVRGIIYGLFATIGTICLGIEIVSNLKNKRYTKQQLYCLAIVAFGGLLLVHKTFTYYETALIAINFMNKSLRSLIKCFFYSTVSVFLLIIALCVLRAIPNLIIEREVDDGFLARYSIGFRHPNAMYRFFIGIVISGAITTRNNKWFLIGVWVIGVGLFLLSNSRTGMLIITLFVVLSLLPKHVKKKYAFSDVIPFAFVGFSILSLLIALFFKDNGTLNNLLSNRPWLWNMYIKDIGLFGQSKSKDFMLDNIFLNTMYCGGLLGFFCYMLLYFISFNGVKNKGNYNLFIIIGTIFLYGMTESFTRLTENYALLFVLIQILDKNKLRELDDDYVFEKVASST